MILLIVIFWLMCTSGNGSRASRMLCILVGFLGLFVSGVCWVSNAFLAHTVPRMPAFSPQGFESPWIRACEDFKTTGVQMAMGSLFMAIAVQAFETFEPTT